MAGMLAEIDPTVGAIILAFLTALIAPTWLSWWNTRQTKKEFKPNGGSSIRDSLNRLEIGLAVNRQTSLTLASVVGVAYFQADKTGAYIYVSRDWQRLAGMFSEDALGCGWVESVHVDDRGKVTHAWSSAVNNASQVRIACRLVNDTQVHITATPIKSPGGALEGFVGFCEAGDAVIPALGFP